MAWLGPAAWEARRRFVGGSFLSPVLEAGERLAAGRGQAGGRRHTRLWASEQLPVAGL